LNHVLSGTLVAEHARGAPDEPIVLLVPDVGEEPFG
jgi:hypothetical protein